MPEPAFEQTAEQQARDLLERIGVEDAQAFTAGDLVELANLIAARARRTSRTSEPDFDQIAEAIISGPGFDRSRFGQFHVRAIVEQLRQVWNARGAADAAVLTEHFNPQAADYGATVILKLDR